MASKIVFVCSDMWKPYLKVIHEKCSEALHILDRFHIVEKMNKATGRSSCLRIAPHRLRRPHSCAEKSRWLLLKREENLKPEQRFRLRDHRELILNYFRAQKLLSSGVVEGLNNKVKVTQVALAAIF